jgi:hypothetical protein
MLFQEVNLKLSQRLSQSQIFFANDVILVTVAIAATFFLLIITKTLFDSKGINKP